MRFAQVMAAVFLTGSLVFMVSASSSVLTDLSNGEATNIVETNNVIHVYNYIGASSEANFLSTFDEGETWSQLPAIPVSAVPARATSLPTKATPYSRYSRSNRNSAVTVESDYVKAVDSCSESGKRWNYRDDTCIEGY